MKRIAQLIPLAAALAACGSTPVAGPGGGGTGDGKPKTGSPVALPQPKDGAPPTAQIDATDTYHQTVVHDPYRWLENPEAPEVLAFNEAQNTHARAFLDKIPGRDALRARLTEILGAATVNYGSAVEVKGTLFALKLEPPKQQRMLVGMPGPDAPGREKVVLDPTTLDASGKTAIDWFRVSPDGKHVAVSISSGGSEKGDVHVYDVKTGKAEADVVPGVNAGTAGGDLAWTADSKGFYYSRYPRGEERAEADKLFYVQLYRHMLGTSTDADVYTIGKDFPRIAEVFVDVADNGDVLCTIQKGDGGEFELWLQLGGYAKNGDFKRLAGFDDKIVQGFWGPKDDLYVVSRDGAPNGKLLVGPRKDFDIAKAKVVIPEGKDALVSDIWADDVLAIHGGKIFVTYQLGGPSELRVFDLTGKALAGPPQLPVSGVGAIVKLGKSDVLFPQSTFVSAPEWTRWTPGSKKTKKTAISSKSPVDLSSTTVVREMAISKDGTAVPVNIILPKGAAKGTPIPFVVTGYGGYGVNIEPAFQAMRSVLLDRGVGLAVLNLRGGGEFGEAWHQGGMLTKKQNVFDDFIAGVEHLVEQKYAVAGKIGIIGGSNGGLLMGAVTTQRPDLFAAVLSLVGIYDMLRVETEPNGAFNTTEFGTVNDLDQFKALYAYSPYHHVTDGTNYPPTLFLTGANDMRVAPWHSRKMVARLQAAAGNDAPHLLVTRTDAGHGIGSSVETLVDQNTDGFSFLLNFLTTP